MSNVDLIREVLRKSKGTALNPRGLTDRLAKKAKLPEANVVLALQELKACGEVQCQAWDPNGRPAAKLFLFLPPEPLKRHEELWEAALEGVLGVENEADITALRPCAAILRNMPQTDMVALVQGLWLLRQEMRDNSAIFKGRRQFDVSAQYLLGSSKLIKALPTRALNEFGINTEVLSGPPRYVVVAGSANPKATILIENPHSFEAAISADESEQFCWIATYGYGLSKSDESFGDQLVDIVSESSSVLTLSRRNPFIEFRAALEQAGERLFFWGDLDLSGLDIYGRLKKQLPGLKLSGLYQPMIEELQRGGGHSYLSTQKECQTLSKFTFDEIKALALLCPCRGVDQEFVDLRENLESIARGLEC